MTRNKPVLLEQRPNPDWVALPLFDRTGWKRVRFGDVVENCAETCDPEKAGLERFVAMEHLEPGSLHVRSWGNVADGTTFTRRCRPGQVLFGKRRAYQRKVAVAEFEAVVSGDIYVLAPKETQRLLPELLPFLCLSERFFQHAVGTSAGSLSPRTNWSSLANFEFDLPPLDQQRRIAEILKTVDEAGEATFRNLEALASLKQIAMQEYTLGRSEHGMPRPMSRLDSVATFQYGLSCALGESGEYPILRMMNYDEELVSPNDLKYADMPRALASGFVVQDGDILFNRTNSADLVGKVGIFKSSGEYLFASYLVRIVTDRTKLLPDFLNYYLNSSKGQSAVRAFATPGVSQANISAGSLKKVCVPVPTLKEQENAVAELDSIAAAHRASRAHLAAHQAMFQNLTNTLFADK